MENTKKCRECDEIKNIDQFYKHKQMFDGHLNKCIKCVKDRVSKHRGENIDKIREYDRNRPNKAERVDKFREYMNFLRDNDPIKFNQHIKHKQDYMEWIKINDTEKYNKYVENKNEANKIWRRSKNHIHNHVARKLVNPHICEKCNSDFHVQGHHEDYSKPLDVIWLCSKCHSARHREIREQLRKEN